jgi:hypothetical protein
MLHALLLSAVLGTCPVEWTVIARYEDLDGSIQTHQETVCGEQAAELRTDEIEAKGFEASAGERIPHAALRRIEYYPFRIDDN